MVPEKYITLQELSSQTGIPYTTLRKWVKKLDIEPDNIEVLPNGVYKYYYSATGVRMLYDHIVSSRNTPVERYRSCYHCKAKVSPEDLHGGLCPLCQAKKVVLNYGCHGDPMKHNLSDDRLDILIEAIKIVRDTYMNPVDMRD